MFNKNNGTNENDILQNQFTSYLSFAVSRARIDFIRAKIARLKREQATDQYELTVTQDSFEIEAFLESEAILQAIKDIREKERYVFLARVLEDKKLREIAEELGMSEKGVAAIYYRTVKKLRDMLEGECYEFQEFIAAGKSRRRESFDRTALNVPPIASEGVYR